MYTKVRGYSLIELLVVVGIILIIAPSLSRDFCRPKTLPMKLLLPTHSGKWLPPTLTTTPALTRATQGR